MFSRDDPEFEQFGQIYFSWIYPGVIKGWHLHKTKTLNYACIKGMIQLAIYDPLSCKFQVEYMGDDRYMLVSIWPGLWNGFCNIGTETAIIANCATHAYSDEDIIRLDPYSTEIPPFDWGRQDG